MLLQLITLSCSQLHRPHAQVSSCKATMGSPLIHLCIQPFLQDLPRGGQKIDQQTDEEESCHSGYSKLQWHSKTAPIASAPHIFDTRAEIIRS